MADEDRTEINNREMIGELFKRVNALENVIGTREIEAERKKRFVPKEFAILLRDAARLLDGWRDLWLRDVVRVDRDEIDELLRETKAWLLKDGRLKPWIAE